MDVDNQQNEQMQQRHKDRLRYFNELATTCERHFLPYIGQFHAIERGTTVLEIGCGEGGNLLPLAKRGCRVTGVDIDKSQIEKAKTYFEMNEAQATFVAEDIFKWNEQALQFDIIICHDVLEHLDNKLEFLTKMCRLIRPDGIVFMAFPAWQMPFGGHQQICRSPILSHIPYVHLLPNGLYRRVIKAFGEDDGCIRELLNIKRTRITIERFEKLLSSTSLAIAHKRLWLVNPHYQTKFHLHPLKMPETLANIPYIRNYLSTSCFYILKHMPAK